MEHSINNKEKLEEFIITHWKDVNQYLDQLSADLPIPIYSSVDIRENLEKFAPVDHNLYPAGFNNLCCQDLDNASVHFRQFLGHEVKTIAIIPENHTNNLFYFEHLLSLQKAFRQAGYESYFISFFPELFDDKNIRVLTSQSGKEIIFHKGFIIENQITTSLDGHLYVKIDAVCLNHDQSKPLEIDWPSIRTPIFPSPFMGWTRRKKSEHFKFYHDVVQDFSNHYSINPHLLEAQFTTVENIDFSSKEGLEQLANHIDEFKKGLNEKTLLFIKANQGTYGMGISVVNSGSDILSMNRKARNKMDVGKNGIKFQSILIQEGIETMLMEENMPAEITIYLVGGHPCGGFLRANSLRGTQDNLNAKGMVLKKFCISEIRQNQMNLYKEAIYSMIARLSTIAAAKETVNALK